jgi:hypothetical protein
MLLQVRDSDIPACQTTGYHGGNYEDGCLSGCCAAPTATAIAMMMEAENTMKRR